MKTIVITGPSGSGKTYLSNKLYKRFYNSIIIKTDSYYRDNKLFKFLSIFLYDIYDRPLSIRKLELDKTLRSINNKDRLITQYKYDFKSRQSSHSKVNMSYTDDNQFLILEGIFAHRLNLNYAKTLNIVCEEEKEVCFTRRLTRDQIYRNREKSEVYKKFNMSWNLYYKNVKDYLKDNKILSIKTREENSQEKLFIHLNNKQKNN